MKIISFTGKSGTGKSFQATALAQSRSIDAIIDDGLLIYKGQIVAGTSAKKCVSKAAAIRTALFNYEEHRSDVVSALVKYHPETLLILGTSDRMTDIIAETLGLHKPDKRIYIEDVTTEEERREAAYSRGKLGEHVIPAPMGQLKRDFSGYFINSIKYIRDRALGNMVKPETPSVAYDEPDDRTVVRPQYSYFGLFTISEKALRDIIDITAEKYYTRLAVIDMIDNGKQDNMVLTIDVKVPYGRGSIDNCLSFQQDVYQAIDDMTSFTVSNVNIRICDIIS
ncbi:MAG: hypothetical protein KBS63_01920 [Clostridiales bacterium]|nr:hypothetical protein [Candidatus Crickella caballi]